MTMSHTLESYIDILLFIQVKPALKTLSEDKDADVVYYATQALESPSKPKVEVKAF